MPLWRPRASGALRWTRPKVLSPAPALVEFLMSGSYWISFFPGIALAIAIIGINLAGDHLRDVLNPRNLR